MAREPGLFNEYRHFVPESRVISDYQKNYQFELIEELSRLKEILVDPQYCAFDLETSSLSPAEGFIVGVALCMDGKTAYYVPIKHAGGPSPGEEALTLLHQFFLACKKCFLFNVRFDFRFMEWAGYDCSEIKYLDVAVPVFLADTNKKMPSLKWAERHFLGWEVQTFAETLGDNPNFYFIDPHDALIYAATDALGTFHLVRATMPFFKEAGIAADVDNQLLYFFMKCEEEETRIDFPALEKIREEVVMRLSELSHEIYQGLGHTFTINSPAQLSNALKSVGVDTGFYNKTGHMKTGGEFLEAVAGSHPAIALLMEYQTLFKAVSSYLNPIAIQAREKNGRLRFSYQTTNAPTGRLSSGKDAKNPFFAAINIQAVTKSPSALYYCAHTGKKDENSIMGWTFIQVGAGGPDPRDPNYSPFIIEGTERHANIRSAFLPDEGHLWVSMDFSGQELRIPALLSGEPVWLGAFMRGEDVHKNTAIALYGEENYSKEKRRLAKIGNFGLLYGQVAYSFAQRHKMSLEEAEEFCNRWWGALKTLKGWVNRHTKEARKTGTVYTLFGRPRRVRWYFEHPNNKIKSFGYRTAVNSVIQGAGSDILKIALLKVCKKVLFNAEYRDSIRFLSTVHDEINYTLLEERAGEIIPLLVREMEIKLPKWPIRMEVGVSVGNSWGWLFEWKLDEDGSMTPKYERVKSAQ